MNAFLQLAAALRAPRVDAPATIMHGSDDDATVPAGAAAMASTPGQWQARKFDSEIRKLLVFKPLRRKHSSFLRVCYGFVFKARC